MISSFEPKEFAQQNLSVLGGTGSKIINLSGYLDGLLIDAPASETYTFSIKGPSGIEYFITPNTLTGDVSYFFPNAIPMCGKMVFTIIGSSGDGLFKLTPIGNLK